MEIAVTATITAIIANKLSLQPSSFGVKSCKFSADNVVFLLMINPEFTICATGMLKSNGFFLLKEFEHVCTALTLSLLRSKFPQSIF